MKLMKMLLSVLLVFAVCGCTKNDVKDGVEETITITLKIEDAMNQKELFTGTVSASGIELTLADVLSANADALQLVSEDTAYGMQINGLMGVETTDWAKGPWWGYTSENNESCVQAGYCTGASELKVADGDEFSFTFSQGY